LPLIVQNDIGPRVPHFLIEALGRLHNFPLRRAVGTNDAHCAGVWKSAHAQIVACVYTKARQQEKSSGSAERRDIGDDLEELFDALVLGLLGHLHKQEQLLHTDARATPKGVVLVATTH
jgi:hypothetical protein